jgi:predicted ATPase/DNA-binding CsgD family transcriptional regulator
MIVRGHLIGREHELAMLDQQINSAGLVTLTGVGGCGKTRLALEVADRTSSRAGPLESLIVELASVRLGGQVVDALLSMLGARERGGRTQMEVVVESLAGRRALLVLDNCEHVAGEVGRLASALLEKVPDVRLLVTSREPLRVPGEAVFRLRPLSLPDSGGDVAAVVRSDAGRFFVDRAATANPGFALTPSIARAVVRICHELDGLPLAIGLAAARVDAISPSDIADRLSRRGRLSGPPGESELPQHRSLRASLDWSYHLLEEQERVLMRRLSTCAGGWTTEAARAIALPAASETDVRGLLDGLEAKGLIMAAPADRDKRWAFLQIVGEYAAEQLVLEGEAAEIRDRHLAWCQAFAAEADGLLLEPGAHKLIDEETPNLRLALAWAIEHDPGRALEIVASLVRHWILAEHFEEGRTATAAALAAYDGEEADAATLALVHCGAGLIGTLSEDYSAAAANTQAGLARLADLDDLETGARCLQMSGMVLILTGLDLREGLQSANRAVELLRSFGDPLGLAWALANVAMAAGVCDQFDAVHAAYDEFLTIPSASQHDRLRTWAELAAAWAEVLVGSPEQALAHADLALSLEGDWPSMTHFIGACHRVHALALLGRTDDALAEGAQTLARAEASGAVMAIPSIELALVMTELMLGDIDAADGRARGLLEMPQMHTVALMREVLARIALARGNAREADTQGRELAAVAERTDSARHRALANFVIGCAAVLGGEPDRGRDLLQAALATHAELGLERGAADVLEELALLAASAGDGARAARLAAAAASTRTRLSCAPLIPSVVRLEAARAHFVARDGRAAWDAAWAEGETLPLAAAIAYARRARGPRDRPAVGWASLTPGELEVAQFAASGISNPKIASQLFISRSTVKMHLSSVYLKLGIANRTELARAIAVRSADADRKEDSVRGRLGSG